MSRQRTDPQIRYGFLVPAVLEEVPKARRRVVELAKFLSLSLDEAATGDLALLAGELIANAIVHTGAPCTVCVTASGSRVQVEVTDVDRGDLSPRRADLDDETGRGLFLINALASDWGTRLDRAGKITWFTLGPERALADGLALAPIRTTPPCCGAGEVDLPGKAQYGQGPSDGSKLTTFA
ncbi:ATP-binding protein [Streptomyces malaysiensis]|uniref:ATP-binding protein n=1 Tax=Streptomyces malaysiensis TaxID=92644 RepID=UPI0028C38A23|nr:ATP-binding protein [Streptomyces malaysiensis]